MVDWTSPEALARDAAVFTKFMHALLGVYVYVHIIPFVGTQLTSELTTDSSGLSPSTLTGPSSLARRSSDGQW